MAFRFETLEVFRLAVDYAELVYRTTRKFPSDEKYGLCANLRRAATSVAQNVAEGSGRGTTREFMRFLDISLGSLFETVAGFLIARRLGFLSDGEVNEIREKAQLLGRKLNSFKRSLNQPQAISHKP